VDTVNDKPGVLIASASEVMAMEDAFLKEREELEKEIDHKRLQSSLTSHIMSVFQRNKDARQTSGIEEKLLQSLRAYNGRYDPEDLSKIKATGGSQIYMNLTPTKCRAAMSWIRDILMSAKEKAWSFSPTTVPDLPEEVSSTIRQRIEQMASELKESGDGSLEGAAAGVQELNQLRIDIEEAIADEIYKLAETEVKKFEDIVADQLDEGDWEEALSEFIEDFCVFQAAIMKGPIITKKKKMTWDKGKPLVSEEYCYLNRRVAPLDIYPSPSATKIDEGDLCEHIRLSRKDLYGLIGVEGYSEEYIRELLDNTPLGNSPDLLDSEIEEEKAIEEYRGDTYAANRDVYHGIHFFGSAPHSLLSDWGVPNSEIGEDTNKEFEVEAILVGDRVIKCMINDDPLLRRPYYKACFQNIPGSWWGRSLPELMRDIQRICNATARALSNNMGIAAGPQIEVYIDRLAADEELESIYPFKMWQVTTDPTGAGGRAVQFWQPSSNASELLAVYKEFELRADDATSIPRYAYGNERSGGAATTASGLSMLLESASKGIKDAIRHIDDGLIKPRVEYQFYWNMITNQDLQFSGDIQVIAKGSQALTMKGAQEMRRNEFLQILGNQTYLQIVGVEGLAEILREMAASLGLGTNIVPSRIELKRKLKQQEAQQQQQVQAEQQNKQAQTSAGVQQVQMQVEQAEMASQRNALLKEKELQQKAEIEFGKMQLKLKELEQKLQEVVSKSTTTLSKAQIDAAQKDRDTNKNLALSIESNYQDKNNQQ